VQGAIGRGVLMSIIKPFTGVDDRVQLADAVPLPAPYVLNIFPSNACNFRCAYCVQSMNTPELKRKYEFKRDLMTSNTFARTMSQAKEFGKLKLVSFTGQGEPLLHKNIAEMVKIVKLYSIAGRVDIVTNGVLLTCKKSGALIDAGLDVLRISFQGITTEKYYSIARAEIDFENLVDNIGYFYSASRGKCKVYAKIPDISLDPGEEEKFYKMFDGITDRMYVEKIMPVYDGVDYSRWNMSLDTDRRGVRHERRKVCPFPFYQLDVWPNGDVVPCPAIHKVGGLGNVNEKHLTEIWESDELREFRMMHLRGERMSHEQCGVCCGPDDCAHPEDTLDGNEGEIMRRMG
jgi:cyclic pyranopterin phosphate synthase